MANKNKQKKSFPVFTVFCIVVVVVLLAIFIPTIISNTGLVEKNTKVLKVGDIDVNALEFRYSYSTVYNQYYQYASYFGVDTSDANWINEKCSMSTEEQTWKEFFISSAKESLVNTLSVYQEAKKSGTIDMKAINQKIDERIAADQASLDEQYTDQKVNVKDFYPAAYGKGFGVSEMRKMLEYSFVASQFEADKEASLKYEQADLEKYYSENKSDFDVYSYVAVNFPYELAEGETNTEEAPAPAAVKAKEDAESFVKANKDEESFVKNGDKNATKRENTAGSSISEGAAAKEWLSGDRKAGDTTVVEGTSAYVALYFIDAHRDEYKLVSARHLTVNVETDDDGNPVEGGEADAQSKATKLFEEIKAASDVEGTFKSKVAENSADTATSGNEGLYEDLTKTSCTSAYGSEVTAWLFDETRKAGDIEMLKTSSGYDIVYFVSFGEPYWSVTAESNLRSKDVSDWESGINDSYKDSVEFNEEAAVKVIG